MRCRSTTRKGFDLDETVPDKLGTLAMLACEEPGYPQAETRDVPSSLPRPLSGFRRTEYYMKSQYWCRNAEVAQHAPVV